MRQILVFQFFGPRHYCSMETRVMGIFQDRGARRALRRGVFAVIALVTLVWPVASNRPACGDDVVNLWSAPSFWIRDDRNIERYATAQVQPPYPVAAQRYRIEGTVTVEVTVNSDGKVSKAEFIRGHSVFRSVSLDAARQWQFASPGNGDLVGTIDFVFRLR